MAVTHTREVQPVVVPQNMGVQWMKRILDASHGGQGFAYDPYVSDITGVYSGQRKGTALTESIKGLSCGDMVCSVVIQT